MISTHRPTAPGDLSSRPVPATPRSGDIHFCWRWLRALHPLLWLCLILACLGANWFVFQCSLVSQPKSFMPDWQGAQWVQATDAHAPVAYFRDSFNLGVLPDSVFITVAANQAFRLYVNGFYINSTSLDFIAGRFPLAYIFDLTSTVRPGTNIVAVRVTNVDEQLPSLRVNIGIMHGNMVQYIGSDSRWRATSQTTSVFPFTNTGPVNTNLVKWTTPDFDANSWPAARIAPPTSPVSPMLTVNPLVYEQPLPPYWMSIGNAHDAYFVRQIQVPSGFSNSWIRLAANGLANVFINGHEYMIWNGQPHTPHMSAASYLSSDRTPAHYRRGIVLGVYDISPYLHAGNNVIAVHVQMAGYSSALVGLANTNASMTLDMLLTNPQGQSRWVGFDTAWHGSSRFVNNWTRYSPAAQAWPSVTLIGRPGVVNTLYLADNTTPRNVQFIPLPLIAEVVFLTTAAVMASWLLLSLLFARLYARSYIRALETMSLAFIPPCALEGLLMTLSRETTLPQPFPYSDLWGGVLVLVTGLSFLALFLNAHYARQATVLSRRAPSAGLTRITDRFPALFFGRASRRSATGNASRLLSTLLRWLAIHWPLVLIMLIALPLISYNLQYEPYWQDELTSYYAAKGILQHGVPMMRSGFIYTKAELYSYILALVMFVLGDSGGVPRLVSVMEYLISLPLFYAIACRFFGRRVAMLATALLAFSPFALSWGQQMRMYEQAQVLTLLVMYLFYRAAQAPQRSGLAYSAFLCLALDYLSHEEVFIIFPALVLCVLLISQKNSQRRFPSVFYYKHWWIAGILCAGIIGGQLLAAELTHPVVLGTDESQRPFIQFTLDNIPYYINLLFFPPAKDPWITVNSLLAVTGCLLTMRSKRQELRYTALFLVISFLTLTLVFTMASERYMYPLLPYYYAIGAYALVVILQRLWIFARVRLAASTPGAPEASARLGAPVRLSFFMRLIAIALAGLVCACVLIMPALPLANYNLFVSRELGLPYHRYRLDLDTASAFMHRNWRPGDFVITVDPAISVYYYIGHLDAFFSVNRSLYLFEHNGLIVDTPTGTQVLLNQQDFEAVLSTHPRVWIISDNGLYQSEVSKYFTYPPDFHLVYEGYGSAIYFRGG